VVFFGGPEQSQLLDAGEWRLIGEVAIKDGSAPPTGDLSEDAERKRSFALGVAAFGEILKFIPNGADAVPESSFWTPHGRAAHDENPGQFGRDYLQRWQRSFQAEMEDRFGEV
jgi:hypothetical protein